jgi:hypothetical protein
MPSLQDISRHFDDIDILDGYTGAFLFKAQVSSFLESAKDGSTNKQRVMSVAPGTAMPARRLLDYFGEKWIVGDGNIDALQNTQLRANYWITKLIDMAIRLTPAEVCNGGAGLAFATSKAYLKDTVNYTTDSEYDPQWDFTISIAESVVKGQFLQVAGTLYRVRTTHTTEGGFLVATADELDAGALVAVQLVAGGLYNPVTEEREEILTDTFGIHFDPTKLFRFVSEADPRYLSGDRTLILSVPASVGSTVIMENISWKVLTCTPELDGWNLHIRRA